MYPDEVYMECFSSPTVNVSSSFLLELSLVVLFCGFDSESDDPILVLLVASTEGYLEIGWGED